MHDEMEEEQLFAGIAAVAQSDLPPSLKRGLIMKMINDQDMIFFLQKGYLKSMIVDKRANQ